MSGTVLSAVHIPSHLIIIIDMHSGYYSSPSYKETNPEEWVYRVMWLERAGGRIWNSFCLTSKHLLSPNHPSLPLGVKQRIGTINLNPCRQLGQETLVLPREKPNQNKNHELQSSNVEHQTFRVSCPGLCCVWNMGYLTFAIGYLCLLLLG